MTTLVERLGYSFRDPELLERALTHRSWCAEHPGYESNERLEFLGDAVLGLIVADHAFRTYPHHGEGWLSRARASVVRATALAEMATDLGVGEHLLLGKGEDASGGREKPSILADSLEAVIGAVYLDGGWHDARSLVLGMLGDRIDRLSRGDADQDHKSRLQELCARLFDSSPDYRISESGPEHDKEFRAEVWVADDNWGGGSGRTKKQAEQQAAEEAVLTLTKAHGHRLPSDVVNGTLAPTPDSPSPDERTDA